METIPKEFSWRQNSRNESLNASCCLRWYPVKPSEGNGLNIVKDVVRFSDLDSGSRQWRVVIQDTASIFSMSETVDQTQKLFEIFEMNKTGVIDLRQILLGMSNFISGVTTEGWCRVVFDLYDENKSGFLAQDEIEQLLMETHLQSRNAVLGKAMTYADTNNAGGIGFNQFLEVALSFPNLLFPTGIFYQLS